MMRDPLKLIWWILIFVSAHELTNGDVVTTNDWVDITESSRVSDIIGSIMGHSMSSFKSQVVVTGGISQIQETLFYSKYVYSLVPPNFEASLITSQPDWTNRAYHASISYQAEGNVTSLYIFGGIFFFNYFSLSLSTL